MPWLTLTLVLVGCGDQPPVPQLELARSPPPVAAEFRTTVESAQGSKSSAQWRFWRSHDRIERENPAAQSGDLWVRDDRTLFHTRLYHADRRGIEYRSEDLQILNASPDWAALATLLDPRLVEALQERDAGGAMATRTVGTRARSGILHGTLPSAPIGCCRPASNGAAPIARWRPSSCCAPLSLARRPGNLRLPRVTTYWTMRTLAITSEIRS